MSEYQYILSIALGQGMLLAFFLLSSRYYKSLANKWLATALILLSVLTITDIIGQEYVSNSVLLNFFLQDLELSFLVYVPFYYFFYISTSETAPKRYFNGYLLIPFVIDTLVNIAIVSLFSIDEIVANAGIQLFYEIETILSIVFNVFLSYKSYQLIRTNVDSSNKRNWIYRIWQSTAVLLLAWILVTVGGLLMSSGLYALVSTLYLILSIWMFWLLYNGVVNIKLIEDRQHINSHLRDKAIQKSQNNIKLGEPLLVEKRPDHHEQSSKRELFDGHFDKINELMISESLYRNEDLSLEDIAQRMDMSTGYISKIIKQTTNKNFPSWVNELRVAEVKAMFTDKDFHHYTTLSIGLEAGFKSKSAFYSSFKKITGETPAKFRKKKS